MTAATWEPNRPLPGCLDSSQELFLACPADEVLLEGGRGGGKTAVLLADFAQEVGQGHGPHWRGILFRETYKQLEDAVLKSSLLYRRFKGAVWNASDFHWTWPDGERLLLRYMKKVEDYWNYHGHEYPWIGWEELCNWATPDCYDMMKACRRSSQPGIPRRIRATTNPWGKGHAWVRKYFVDPAETNTVIRDEKTGWTRVRIYAPLEENTPLTEADPTYAKSLEGAEDENLRKAWRGKKDRWDINAGAYFADTWATKVHALEPFKIPVSWRVDRAFDWGSSKPFSVGWYAESDGTEATIAPGKKKAWPRGTLFRISEWYGWNGKPNEGLRMLATAIAKKIVEYEKTFQGTVLSGQPVQPGPADSSIWDEENGKSIANDMSAAGVRWERADKSPGSRVQGAEQARKLLAAPLKAAQEKKPLEEPGFFVFSTCRHFLRLIPTLPRDERDPDDVDTSAEDHVWDEWRYRVLAMDKSGGVVKVPGYWR